MTDRRAEIESAYRLSGQRNPFDPQPEEPRYWPVEFAPSGQAEDQAKPVTQVSHDERLADEFVTAVKRDERLADEFVTAVKRDERLADEFVTGELVEDHVTAVKRDPPEEAPGEDQRPGRALVPARLMQPAQSMQRPARCTATSRRSGKRCENFPIRGHRVCRMHGGSTPAVREAAAWNLALEQVMRPEDARPVWEVLLSAVAAADGLMMRAAAAASDAATVEQLEGLAKAVERASRLAQTAIASRAHEAVAMRADQYAGVVARCLNAAIDAAMLTDDQEYRARAAMRRELEELDAGR